MHHQKARPRISKCLVSFCHTRTWLFKLRPLIHVQTSFCHTGHFSHYKGCRLQPMGENKRNSLLSDIKIVYAIRMKSSLLYNSLAYVFASTYDSIQFKFVMVQYLAIYSFQYTILRTWKKYISSLKIHVPKEYKIMKTSIYRSVLQRAKLQLQLLSSL